jgi:hypothetical protein
MNDQSKPEAARQYGELFYHSSAVSALLRVLAKHLEGEQRAALFRLSHDLPTTMSWADSSPSVQSDSGEHHLCRFIQLGLQHDDLLRGDTVRLTVLLRNGPSPVGETDWEPIARMAYGQSDAL